MGCIMGWRKAGAEAQWAWPPEGWSHRVSADVGGAGLGEEALIQLWAAVVSDACRVPSGASGVPGTKLLFSLELLREEGPEDLPGRKAIWSVELEPRPIKGRGGGGSLPASRCWPGEEVRTWIWHTVTLVRVDLGAW